MIRSTMTKLIDDFFCSLFFFKKKRRRSWRSFIIQTFSCCLLEKKTVYHIYHKVKFINSIFGRRNKLLVLLFSGSHLMPCMPSLVHMPNQFLWTSWELASYVCFFHFWITKFNEQCMMVPYQITSPWTGFHFKRGASWRFWTWPSRS